MSLEESFIEDLEVDVQTRGNAKVNYRKMIGHISHA